MASNNDNRTNILFRYGLIVAAILFLSGAIVVKMFETCVVDADMWNARLHREMSEINTITPTRGNILASDGSKLAVNLNYYTARIDFLAEGFNEEMYLDSLPKLSRMLAERFPARTAEEWEAHLKAPILKYPAPNENKRPRAYQVLTGMSHADTEDMRRMPYFKRGRNKSGLHFEKYMRRFNPYGEMARRSIGKVAQNESIPGIHGISGLEKALDHILYGTEGSTRKVNLTKNIVDWAETPAIPGSDIVTTIDIGIQDIVENELNNVLDSCGAEWGMAILMDVKTGDIKAISNLEPNPDAPGYIEALNRAMLPFEPGSVIKTLSMMIAIEDGIVSDLDSIIPTGASWAYAGGRPITDSHYTSQLTVAEVIEQSSNIGMARIITSRYSDNPGAFYDRIKQTGFLDPMNTGIAGEQTPRIDRQPNNRGGRIAMSRQCYGYATEIPPIYTLALYNAIANGGEFVKPRLVKEIRGATDSVLQVEHMGSGRICSPRTAELMRGLLTNVVWGDHGTGRFLRNDLVRIAGKTGTCYMIEDKQYNTSKKRLAFCGFFPAENPKYSCMVLTCHPTRNFFGAATTSGQVLRNIALKLYSRGMLDNSSEYASDTPSTDAPTFFATRGENPFGKVKTRFALPSRRSLSLAENTPAGGVPDVRRLDVREAVMALESQGYNVAFSGTGFVSTQEPAPGTHAAAGTTVRLRLSR